MIDRNAKKTEDGFDADELEQESMNFGDDQTDDEAMDDEDDDASEPRGLVLPNIGSTPVDFARLGITQMAYIRQALVNSEQMWAIFSAAGDPLGAASSFDQAWAAVKQHNLEPMRVH